ncbi:hypothetical protein [Muricoccus vinaceus]
MLSFHSAIFARPMGGLLVWRLAGPLIAATSVLLWIALANAFRQLL